MTVISYAPLSPEDRVRRRRVLFSDYNNAKRYKNKPARPKADPVTEPVAVPKGHCANCGQHIGRGVAFHQKHCAG